MKVCHILNFWLVLFLFNSCTKGRTEDTASTKDSITQIKQLSEGRTESERGGDLKSFLAFYDEDAVSMPEYQPILSGINEITIFYNETFDRQKIESLERTVEEIIALGNTFVEIGIFKKVYTDLKKDTVLFQNGKYWNVWSLRADGTLKLKGEAFGFFHPIEDPGALVVRSQKINKQELKVYREQEIPLELRAYNALNEKYVKSRAGALRSNFYTEDARFMPFSGKTVAGIENIEPYLVAYSSGGDVTVDPVSVYTYDFEYSDDNVLEYYKFYAKWKTADFLGESEGKGIRIWKRQEDKSLKIYREIGTHNHLE